MTSRRAWARRLVVIWFKAPLDQVNREGMPLWTVGGLASLTHAHMSPRGSSCIHTFVARSSAVVRLPPTPGPLFPFFCLPGCCFIVMIICCVLSLFRLGQTLSGHDVISVGPAGGAEAPHSAPPPRHAP